MCVLLFFFFFIRSILSLTPVSSRTNPDEFPHLASSWIKDVRISSGSQVLSWLYSVFCVCSHFDSSVCLVVPSSEPQQRRKKKKKNQGMGMTQQQGVQNQSFLLAPLSWEPSGRRRGVRSAVEQAQHASAHEKAWLTIPFEATGCKGAGHRQVTTKMGLIVRSEPRGGSARWTRSYARAEAHLYPLIGPPLFNQRPSGESRY